MTAGVIGHSMIPLGLLSMIAYNFDCSFHGHTLTRCALDRRRDNCNKGSSLTCCHHQRSCYSESRNREHNAAENTQRDKIYLGVSQIVCPAMFHVQFQIAELKSEDVIVNSC